MTHLSTIVLLAFMAIGPLCARAMPGPETTDTSCMWQACGDPDTCLGVHIVSVRSCDNNGVEKVQYCC
ncbi:hypothetical protein CY34DRAFT_813567 [Suillus luteus UH-Slu-Lm8-n1]|uniref:Long chronological lifespan protein 2 n=1 Tax=Suillus luteus UH-Slu-Lm8-n1 TaxID=930992 RepID=A0A0D0A5R1_9AGAM|nr:hypothetical protein CY34DRAFT_813567 [Suillus luteus UH-Slu-Lm8-n1]